MKPLVLILLLISSVALADDRKIGDRTVNVPSENEVMNKAIAKARASLDNFLEIYERPPESADRFRVKVLISDDNGAEHLWFEPFKEIEGGFAGVLANEPQTVKSVEYSKVYVFKREQITDWGYSQNGIQHGSYTVCAMFQFMEEDVVNRYKNDHGFVCED